MPKGSKLVVLAALVLSLSMWHYVDFVLIPFQKLQSEMIGRPTGNQSDLYPRWLGARELLLHGRNPYSEEVTREIQTGYFGRPLDASRPGDPRDQSRFAYPLYVVFLFWPTIHLPFRDVQIAFALVMVLLTAASVRWWTIALRVEASASTQALIGILLLGSFAFVQAIHLQQLTLLVAALIAGASASVAKRRYALGGVLLALAAIKPQLVVPIICFYVLWSLADMRNRRGLLFGFSGTMAVLLAAAEWKMPNWFPRWWTALHDYMAYTDARSLVQVAAGRLAGPVLGAALIATVAVLCWRARKCEPGSGPYAIALNSVLAVTLLIIPKWAPYDQMLLVPVFLCLATSGVRLRQISLPAKFLYAVAALMVAWPWIAALTLMMIWLFGGASRAAKLWALPLVTVMFVPAAVAWSLAVWIYDRTRNDKVVAMPAEMTKLPTMPLG